MNELDAKWTDYRFRTVPLDASEPQVIESRRAYMGGAMAALELVSRRVVEMHRPDAYPAAINELRAEVDRFRADVLAGRA